MAYGNISIVEKTTLYLPSELHRALRAQARRSGKPQAELVREALTAYLDALPQQLPRSLGVGEDVLTGGESEDWLAREWSRR